ncbi:MAG: CvpA family protein, partial [Gilliamella sp.]|nr:CvpA family protein [Gilliamella sp.]
MNWVDFTIIGIIAFSALISIVRGFVREALSLISWILAFF